MCCANQGKQGVTVTFAVTLLAATVTTISFTVSSVDIYTVVVRVYKNVSK